MQTKLLAMENFKHLDGEEKLKAENDFLKIKIMLEHGGQFSNASNERLPAEVENEFLKGVIEFEKQFDEQKTIKVFDKIGRPDHFKPVAEITDDKIREAWNELNDYLDRNNIRLDACNPNISSRELYRFTIEELFEHEMEDISLPGMICGFIYDEFHPDPVYDNANTAQDDCIRYILQKEPMEWTHSFREQSLRLNDHFPLTIEQFSRLTDNFKNAYDAITINEIKCLETAVNENDSFVRGSYKIAAMREKEVYQLTGNWKVVFEKDEELGYWYINTVNIEGIQF